MEELYTGEVDQSIDVVLQNLDGTPKTGVLHTDITAAYARGLNTADVPIVLAALALITTAHTDGGWKERNATTMPGVYRLDLPDAVSVAGVNKGTIAVVHATALPCTTRFSLAPQVTVLGGKIAAMLAAGDLAPNTVTAATLAGDAVAEIQDGLATSAALAADIATVLAALDLVPTAVENADALLARNINGGSSAGRTVTQALKRLRNRVAVVAGTMTVYNEDDLAANWTAALTTAPGNPVSEVHPV